MDIEALLHAFEARYGQALSASVSAVNSNAYPRHCAAKRVASRYYWMPAIRSQTFLRTVSLP
jgi:hypothetical protein